MEPRSCSVPNLENYSQVLGRYRCLLARPMLSEAEADELYKILARAIYDGQLAFLLDDIDHFFYDPDFMQPDIPVEGIGKKAAGIEDSYSDNQTSTSKVVRTSSNDAKRASRDLVRYR